MGRNSSRIAVKRPRNTRPFRVKLFFAINVCDLGCFKSHPTQISGLFRVGLCPKPGSFGTFRATKAGCSRSAEAESRRFQNFARFLRSSSPLSWLEIPSLLTVQRASSGPQGARTPWFGFWRPVKWPEIPVKNPPKYDTLRGRWRRRNPPL